MPLTPTVLGNVTLGFEPVWNRRRSVFGYRLWVDAPQQTAVDGAHFLQALIDCYPQAGQRPLLLHIRNKALLDSVLEHDGCEGLWVCINPHTMEDPHWAPRLRVARARGITLVWQGEPGSAPPEDLRPHFAQQIRSLSAPQSLAALRSALRQAHDSAWSRTASSTLEPGAIYDGLASPALVEYALDHCQARAVIGWPLEEVLHQYQQQALQPSHTIASKLLVALDNDVSIDDAQTLLSQEPLLAYRFLRWVNSASMAVGRPLQSIRQGLMAVGYSQVRDWLLGQLPHTCSDPNLNPVRLAMVLRAGIMEHLCEAGAEEELRREVFLCGLFSQLDLLLGQPLAPVLARLPLPDRVDAAIVGQSGPYAALLDVAAALERSHAGLTREVCREHEFPLEIANRALLRALAQSPNY